jgi:tetratricopeptide (TPR) repeat protein
MIKLRLGAVVLAALVTLPAFSLEPDVKEALDQGCAQVTKENPDSPCYGVGHLVLFKMAMIGKKIGEEGRAYCAEVCSKLRGGASTAPRGEPATPAAGGPRKATPAEEAEETALYDRYRNALGSRNFDGAVTALQSLVKRVDERKDTEHSAMYTDLLGHAYFEKQDYASAREWSGKSVAAGRPTAINYFTRSAIAIKANDLREARRILAEGMAKFPGDANLTSLNKALNR